MATNIKKTVEELSAFSTSDITNVRSTGEGGSNCYEKCKPKKTYFSRYLTLFRLTDFLLPIASKIIIN